jgi:hypothetical protein
MESYALPIFRAGHIPILGEWLALPLVELAGSKKIGDEAFSEIFHPIAVRRLESVTRCYAWAERRRELMRWYVSEALWG